MVAAIGCDQKEHWDRVDAPDKELRRPNVTIALPGHETHESQSPLQYPSRPISPAGKRARQTRSLIRTSLTG